jgi:hypothetical protein
MPLLLSVLLLLSGLPLIVRAQNLGDFSIPPVLELQVPTTVDARSAAMGRTAIVSAAGSNAIFSNPALIAILDGKQFQAGGRLLFGSIGDGSSDDPQYAPHPKFNHLAFSMHYQILDSKIKTYFGIGYQTYYDWGFKVTIKDIDAELDESGGLNTISPAAAVNIQDKYFLGFSFHKSIFGKLSETVKDDFGDRKHEVETAASFIILGGAVKLSPQVMLGAIYRSAFGWEWRPEIEELNLKVEGDLNYPAIFGVGITYMPSSALTLAGEIQTRPFSGYNILGVDVYKVGNGFNLRLGVELQGKIPLRFGFFRDAKLAHEKNSDGPISMYGFTGGLGINVNRIAMDGAMEYAFSELDKDIERIFQLRLSAKYKL